MFGYWREGRYLRLKTSTFKLYHIICQLGLALDNVIDNLATRSETVGFLTGVSGLFKNRNVNKDTIALIVKI